MTLLSIWPDAPVADAPYDVLIRNGKIIDGSGNPWVSGDIAIRGDRIVKIGKLENTAAKRVIDASGLVVSPGFIDMLGQSELALLIDNRSLSKLSQGITTEITGEGGSVAPQDALTLSQLPARLGPVSLEDRLVDLNRILCAAGKNGHAHSTSEPTSAQPRFAKQCWEMWIALPRPTNWRK